MGIKSVPAQRRLEIFRPPPPQQNFQAPQKDRRKKAGYSGENDAKAQLNVKNDTLCLKNCAKVNLHLTKLVNLGQYPTNNNIYGPK